METLKKLVPAIAVLGVGLSVYALMELSKTKKTLHNLLIIQGANGKILSYYVKGIDNLTDADVKDLQASIKTLEDLQKSVKA